MLYSPRNIRIACDHAGLTHYGGVYFLHEFLRVLRLFRLPHSTLAHSRDRLCRIARIHGHSATSYFSAIWCDAPSTSPG